MKKLVAVLAAAIFMAVPALGIAAVANDEVTSAKIKEATAGSTNQDTNTGNGVKTGHIVDTAITTAKIANGAVTDDKITGIISTSKLNVGAVAGTVAAGDHSHDSVYQKKYANLIVVAKSGGDFTDPVAAVNSIMDASASNPYLVKIMPGTYDISTSGILVIRPNIDIEGSGVNMTTIKGNYTASDFNSGLVYAISDSEIRSLTIDNYGNIAFFS